MCVCVCGCVGACTLIKVVRYCYFLLHGYRLRLTLECKDSHNRISYMYTRDVSYCMTYSA